MYYKTIRLHSSLGNQARYNIKNHEQEINFKMHKQFCLTFA